jgi:hypothetical protein
VRVLRQLTATHPPTPTTSPPRTHRPPPAHRHMPTDYRQLTALASFLPPLHLRRLKSGIDGRSCSFARASLSVRVLPFDTGAAFGSRATRRTPTRSASDTTSPHPYTRATGEPPPAALATRQALTRTRAPPANPYPYTRATGAPPPVSAAQAHPRALTCRTHVVAPRALLSLRCEGGGSGLVSSPVCPPPGALPTRSAVPGHVIMSRAPGLHRVGAARVYTVCIPVV